MIFFGAGSVILYLNGQLDLVGVALAHGLVIAVMVSQMAHLSGGVFNPAIQIALWVTGKMPSSRTLIYLGAQLLGGICGALLLKFLVPAQAFDAAFGGTPTLGDGISSGKGILLEAIGTFFLVWAVFATIVDDRGPFGEDGRADDRTHAHVRHPGDRPVDRRRVQPRAVARPGARERARGTTGSCGSWVRSRGRSSPASRTGGCSCGTRNPPRRDAASPADPSGSLTRP